MSGHHPSSAPQTGGRGLGIGPVVIIAATAVVVVAAVVVGGIFALRAWDQRRALAAIPDGSVYLYYEATAADGGQVPKERLRVIAYALEVRLVALGADDVTSQVVGDGFVLAVPPEHREALNGLGTRVPTTQFRPVLEVVPTACGGDPPPGGDVVCALDDGGPGYRLAPPALTSDDIEAAEATKAPGGADGYLVAVTLTGRGARNFGQLTTRLAGAAPPANRLAVVAAGAVVSAPTILEPIAGGEVRITGEFTEDEANRLAQAMLARPDGVTLHRGELTT